MLCACYVIMNQPRRDEHRPDVPANPETDCIAIAVIWIVVVNDKIKMFWGTEAVSLYCRRLMQIR